MCACNFICLKLGFYLSRRRPTSLKSQLFSYKTRKKRTNTGNYKTVFARHDNPKQAVTCNENYQRNDLWFTARIVKLAMINERMKNNLIGHICYLNASTRRARDGPLLVLVLIFVLVSRCSCFRCQKPFSSFPSHLSPFLLKNSNSQIDNS